MIGVYADCYKNETKFFRNETFLTKKGYARGVQGEGNRKQGAAKMFRNEELINEMNKLKKFSSRLTGNAVDADDLLQATVLRAMEKRHQFYEGTNLFSWTSKIMFNLFVSGYRRKTRFESQYDPEIIIGAQSTGASQEMELELRNVQRAMKRLSEDHREILLMVCVQGMQYTEVAELLDIPVGTVRSRLSRARESLQTLMERNDNYARGKDYTATFMPASPPVSSTGKMAA